MSEYHSKRVRAKHSRRRRTHQRIRNRVQGTTERPRLAVFKSLRYIYAQVIDDSRGVTLVQANSCEEGLQKAVKSSPGSRAAARAVGEALAERAKEAGVQKVVFDRGGFIYHGKIREVAEGARGKGLEF